MINSLNYLRSNHAFLAKTYFQKKGSRFSIAAFVLLIGAYLSFTGCESPGAVGEDLLKDEKVVESETFNIDDYSILQENSYSGRLTYTSMGYFEDPAYGTVRSVALLKPSISKSEIDTLEEGDAISLRLIFDGSVYGDSLADSEYKIYEAGEIWRGNELRFNATPVSIDLSSEVAGFQLPAQQDTIVVDLDYAWTEKFMSFFNADTSLTSAERDSVYIYNFPGLAIVPSENNRNIRFLKNVTTGDNTGEDTVDELITSFLVDSQSQDDDTEPQELSVRDWGAFFTRQNEPPPPDGDFVLHNTDRVLKFQFNLPYEELAKKNIVNARFVLSKDDTHEKALPYIKRPENDEIRVHVFDKEPRDLMADIFANQALYSTSLDDSADAFILNITQEVLNEVYGNEKETDLYLTIQSINGIIYSSSFFDQTAPDAMKPRLVITFAE